MNSIYQTNYTLDYNRNELGNYIRRTILGNYIRNTAEQNTVEIGIDYTVLYQTPYNK